MKRVIVFGFLMAMAGCTAPPPPVTSAQPPFNPHDGQYVLRHGRNTIEGRAVMLRPDGSLASCAGAFATLVPDIAYIRARLARIYGRSNVVAFANAPKLPHDPHFDSYTTNADCTEDGRFRFTGVPDGWFFVVAPLREQGEGPLQGVSVRRKLRVRGGEVRSVILKP